MAGSLFTITRLFCFDPHPARTEPANPPVRRIRHWVLTISFLFETPVRLLLSYSGISVGRPLL
jgi:hypothetical protein